MTSAHSWTFLSNHAHVLICLSRDGGLRTRDLAERVGITERSIQRIIGELVEAGYLLVRKEGRRNMYAIKQDLPLRHPVEGNRLVADLLRLAN